MKFKKTKVPKGVELIEFAWRPADGSPQQTITATPQDSFNMLDAFMAIYPGFKYDGWREPAAGPKLSTELIWSGKAQEYGWRIYKDLRDDSVFLIDKNSRTRTRGDGKTPKVSKRIASVLSALVLSVDAGRIRRRAPKKGSPKKGNPSPKRWSVRCKTTDGNWRSVESELTKAEAAREAKIYERKGYESCVFEGRRKVK